jgi:hypothetical protein
MQRFVQAFELRAHSRIPDFLFSVLGNAERVAGGERGFFVVQPQYLFANERMLLSGNAANSQRLLS